MCFFLVFFRECSGSVVECLARDRGAAVSSLTGVTVVSLSKNINPSLLVQPRKTLPFLTERLLMGRKESNQTKYSGVLILVQGRIPALWISLWL